MTTATRPTHAVNPFAFDVPRCSVPGCLNPAWRQWTSWRGEPKAACAASGHMARAYDADPTVLVNDEWDATFAKLIAYDRNGCWIWQGTLQERAGGYPILVSHPIKIYAHRRSLEIATGVRLGALLACHHCDTPPCVRPDHLFAGTVKDNAQDALAKGRLVFDNPCGEMARHAILTDAQVAEIRLVARSDAEYATRFHVSERAINRARRALTFPNVTIPPRASRPGRRPLFPAAAK